MRFLTLILIFFCLGASAQEPAAKEKIYLHVDKSTYAPLDTLWFKAYLIDPASNSYSNLSGLIYVDMVNANGTVVQTLSLPTKLGISWGSLVLNPKIYESGAYTLRGYTNWMQNFGETYFFKKQIKIVSVPDFSSQKSAAVGAAELKKESSSVKSTRQDPSIQFLPEGGNWIVGKLQKMAFKAIAPNGKGIAVEGEVRDSKSNAVASFKSNGRGMGYFTLLAEPEENYTAHIKIGRDLYDQQLPRPKKSGTTLIVKNDYALDSLVITILSDVPDQTLKLIGQSKGLVCFSANFPPDTKRRTIKVAKRVFPTGVSQIILQDRDQVLNERNLFIHHQDQLQVNMVTPSTTFANRDSIPVQIKVNDAQQRPVGGSFSIAITDDNQVQKNEDSDNNILSYFLLSSDLKGEIEDPGYYFKDFNEQKHNDLEALCLTQGWVSYNWNLGEKPKYRVEKEYTISGKITNIGGKPVANAKVSILGRNKGMMIGNTTSNEKGEFVFKDLPPMDSAVFVLKILNSKGKLGSLGVIVDEFRQVPIKSIPLQKTVKEGALDSIELNFVAIKQQEYRANPASGIALRAVTIVGKKIIKGSRNLNGPGEADQTITREELERTKSKTLLEVLKEKVKGFRTGTDDFYIHNSNVRLIIDGIDVDDTEIRPQSHFSHLKFFFDYYTVADIEGIELMIFEGNRVTYQLEYRRNPGIFIEVTTKSGEGPFLKKAFNTTVIKPMNYGDNKVFYSPKYTVANKNNKKPDLRSTIYWAPNIVTNTKGEANFSFFSADRKGSYTVWIEGSDMQGKFGFSTMKLKIN